MSTQIVVSQVATTAPTVHQAAIDLPVEDITDQVDLHIEHVKLLIERIAKEVDFSIESVETQINAHQPLPDLLVGYLERSRANYDLTCGQRRSSPNVPSRRCRSAERVTAEHSRGITRGVARAPR